MASVCSSPTLPAHDKITAQVARKSMRRKGGNMEPNSSALFVWQTDRWTWMCLHVASGYGASGSTRDEVLRQFSEVWRDRSTVQIIEHAPPPPKRPEQHAPVAEAIEQAEEHRRGHAVYKRLLLEFHT